MNNKPLKEKAVFMITYYLDTQMGTYTHIRLRSLDISPQRSNTVLKAEFEI